MSSIIQLLPDHVANQIAAGEVVQRPASVVKELLENAVDAQATEIKLLIKEAGKSLVQVIDNGIGMSVTDARMCFERHATSKIRIAEDLFQLNTKGFRGEALASIAAIAHVELKTRQSDDQLGTQIVIEGSKIVSQQPSVTPQGTSIAVKNLFFNIPARRNFLKSDVVENKHIIDEFQRVVLAHPNIHFFLYINGNEVYNLPAGNLRQRIVAVFSGKTNERILPVQEHTEVVGINGFIGKPEFAKKSRTEQFLFVNDRFIKSGYLHHAIMGGFEGLIRDGLQPSYFIYLQIDPKHLDINIHPTKTEIKFDDEHTIYAILRSAVKHCLGQFKVAPALDFDKDPSLETPYELYRKEINIPSIGADPNFNPFGDTPKNAKPSSFSKGPEPAWKALYTDLPQEFPVIEAEFLPSQTKLFEEERSKHDFSNAQQLFNKYIVAKTANGLLIVDQNKAHQRILYENFLKNITVSKGFSQQLLFPISMQLNGPMKMIFNDISDALFNIGFQFETTDSEHISIIGIPTMIQESEAEDVIKQLITVISEGQVFDAFDLNDKIAKSLAMSVAIRNGQLLSSHEIDAVLQDLFSCMDHSVSPFGKPIHFTFTQDDLDRKFAL